MAYVDGFVVPVAKDQLADYRKFARKAGKIWREHGALSHVVCVGDDVPVGKRTSFTRAVKLKENEVVVLSWVTYPSRAARDQVIRKVMADKRIAHDTKSMPFDGRRMIFGGFRTMMEL